MSIVSLFLITVGCTDFLKYYYNDTHGSARYLYLIRSNKPQKTFLQIFNQSKPFKIFLNRWSIWLYRRCMEVSLFFRVLVLICKICSTQTLAKVVCKSKYNVGGKRRDTHDIGGLYTPRITIVMLQYYFA